MNPLRTHFLINHIGKGNQALIMKYECDRVPILGPGSHFSFPEATSSFLVIISCFLLFTLIENKPKLFVREIRNFLVFWHFDKLLYSGVEHSLISNSHFFDILIQGYGSKVTNYPKTLQSKSLFSLSPWWLIFSFVFMKPLL